MQALLVKVNDRRVRLAGVNSNDCHVVGLVEFLSERKGWVARLDVTVLDIQQRTSGTWPMQALENGDIVTMQIVDVSEVDAFETQTALPEILLPDVIQQLVEEAHLPSCPSRSVNDENPDTGER